MRFLAGFRLLPWLLFSYSGRISKREYRLALAFLVCAFFAIGLLLPFVVTRFVPERGPTFFRYRFGSLYVLLAVTAYILGALSVKRSHDRGSAGIWVYAMGAAALISVGLSVIAETRVPALLGWASMPLVISMILFVKVFIWPLIYESGDPDENEYGPPPPR